MRAARYQQTGPAAKVLEVVDVDRPEPGPGEVRVALVVSGVNPTDWKSRSGATGTPPTGWQIPHHDGAGTIDAVGPGVEPSRMGERVWVWLAAANRPWGTAAEWTVVPSSQAVALPDGVSFDLGAMLGVPAMTAHRCLFADGPLEGMTVLVAGGAGAVGHFAIELAKHAGAKVIATVSSEEKAQLARAASADAVVNYRGRDTLSQIRAVTPTMDRIVEVAFGANTDLDLSVSGPGTVISVYATETADPILPLRRCMAANLLLRFVLLYGVPQPTLEAAAADITAALRGGALSPLPVHRFSLDQVAAAHDAVEAGVVGKVLIDLR
ncbi:MAG: NADPH:quinone reductase [Pseudonocardiales bacterium]|nr:NADPH:quinone reductase [Pseudonocardiales bacterium]MBV9729290.1 NADPH:quinone reductase [Pseudonocardiales bacterium]